MANKFISVIIPSLGRPELKGTLESLNKQTYPFNQFEVIVVVDSVIDIEKFIEKKYSKLTLTVLENKTSCMWPNVKRNLGVKHSKGNILAFIDDDCCADPSWLSEINSAYEKKSDLVGVEGLTWNDSKKLFEQAVSNLEGGLYQTCNLSIVLKKLFLVQGDIRLFKKFPKEYVSHFGFPAQGNLKLTLATLLFIISAIFFSKINLVFIFPIIVAYFLFKIFFEIKKQFTFMELIFYVFLSFIRDCVFIFYFIYYFATIHPAKNKTKLT